MDTRVDVLIFADASYDSRVFALAHERLAMYQVLLWSWNCNTLGIPTIDYFVMPTTYFAHVKCKVLADPTEYSSSLSATSSSEQVVSNISPEYDWKFPQEFLAEQVIIFALIFSIQCSYII